MEFFLNLRYILESGIIIPFHCWTDVVFHNKQSSYFWFYLNGQPPTESLQRLLNKQYFISPRFHDFELEWYMEGANTPPTIQDFINYCKTVKNYL
jgi:hypothetical protein